MPTKDGKRLREQIIEGAEQIEDDEIGQNEWEVVSRCIYCSSNYSHIVQVMLIDPGQFKIINELLQKECKGKGKLETLTFTATAAGASA
jgi:ribosome maturation protein SDO1